MAIRVLICDRCGKETEFLQRKEIDVSLMQKCGESGCKGYLLYKPTAHSNKTNGTV